ncbi:MAG: glycosyltransferase, partial [Acidimicrobiia bacterium]|nr:glycosyltransferase [Acidimicrobiia bacterium]
MSKYFEPGSGRRKPSIGFVSTYPPTKCGIATFTASLWNAIATGRGSDDGLDVVALVEVDSKGQKPEVICEHLAGDANSLDRAVETLQAHDVAVVQHEYGIYGGRDGEEVLDFAYQLDVPTVVILHTVLESPTPRQKMILEAIVDQSDRAVVLSKSALRRLASRYDVDQRKLAFIPHGAAQGLSGPSLATGTRPLVMTWGLISPGKGLETSIEAFGALTDIRPLPRYLILGGTHPKVHASQGDAYLSGLKAGASALGLDGVVEFGGRYLDLDPLVMAIREANVILIPYESKDQVTSGVL